MIKQRDWVETNNQACAILRQVHDMLALASYPPRKTWVGLTDDERINISYKANGNECVAVELTEAKLKEKNND